MFLAARKSRTFGILASPGTSSTILEYSKFRIRFLSNFFGLDVVELLIGLWKALLSTEVQHEFLHVSYRESSSDYSGLYLLV